MNPFSTVLACFLIFATCSMVRAGENFESSCDPSVRQYFGWCEQWNCRDNCSCTTNDECRQYCESSACKHMECRSDMTCTQSLHSTKRKPRAIQVQAESPFVTQDCSEGECDNLVATRPERSNKDVKYFAFQNCVDGKCKNISSHVEITKQFCGHCDHMECSGARALNCTQKCVVNSCRVMYCDAKQCEQVCSHGSHCDMICGPNAIDCVQMCHLGSKCSMQCNAKNCRYNCTHASGCNIRKATTESIPSTKIPSRRASSTPVVSTRKDTPIPDLESNSVETDRPYHFKPINNNIFKRAKYDTLSTSNCNTISIFVYIISLTLSLLYMYL